MKTGIAMEILGLVGTAVAELKPADVTLAFAEACRLSHPDTRPTDASAPQFPIKRLQAARDLLIAELAGLGRACKLCRGVGTVRGRFGGTPCGACKGTGDKQ